MRSQRCSIINPNLNLHVDKWDDSSVVDSADNIKDVVEHLKIGIMTAESSSVPVIDFAGWTSNASLTQKKAIANKLIDACRTVGFVYIVNHQLSPDRLAHAFEWSKKLFDLGVEQKMLAPHPSGYTVHRGYSWPGLEKVSNAMGDEDDTAELTKNLRQVSDVKVRIEPR